MKVEILKNKKGSALLWVVLMTIIITILLGAVMAATYAYFNYTTITVKRQQAYFTARSAISTCLEELTAQEQIREASTSGAYAENTISILPEKNKSVEITDFGFGDNMGTATAKISRNDSDEVKIEVTAKYVDQTYKMKATVMRQPLYFAGIAVKNLTLNGNLSLGTGTDFYWNNENLFDPSSSNINKGNYTLTINGNFVSKGDAKIPAGTTVAAHKFNKTVNFTTNGDVRHSRKIWSPSEYIISNKTLYVDDSNTTEYKTDFLNTLSNVLDTHPVYCNNGPKLNGGGEPEAFGSKFKNTTLGTTLTNFAGYLGLSNIINDLADENLKLSNSETDALAIQYIEVLSLSNTIDNALEEAKANVGYFGQAIINMAQTASQALNNFKYNYLDVSYIDYGSTDEGNRSDEVIPLTYMFVRGGDASGLTVRVRYGNEPGKRVKVAQDIQNFKNNITNVINSVFSIDNKPSYMVFYLENNATLHIGYDDDGARNNDNPEDLIFLYSVYGGKNTKVVIHDGVIVLGEIIVDELDIRGDAQIIYASTNGSQMAKQKIAEYWAVSNYSD